MIKKNYSKFEVKEEFKTLSFNNVLLYREDTKMYQVIFLSLLNHTQGFYAQNLLIYNIMCSVPLYDTTINQLT